MTEATIWKWQLQPGENEIKMPVGAHVLSVGNQREMIMLWALIGGVREGAGAAMETRRFTVIGTGWFRDAADVPPDGFVGTVLVDEGRFVWHVFEVAGDD